MTHTIEAKVSEPIITPYLNGWSFEAMIMINGNRRSQKQFYRFVVKPIKLWLKTPEQP